MLVSQSPLTATLRTFFVLHAFLKKIGSHGKLTIIANVWLIFVSIYQYPVLRTYLPYGTVYGIRYCVVARLVSKQETQHTQIHIFIFI